MTEYKCRHGFKYDISEEKCWNEDEVTLVGCDIRAFCAFCSHDGLILSEDEKGRPCLRQTCRFIRADLPWTEELFDEYDMEAWEEWEYQHAAEEEE